MRRSQPVRPSEMASEMIRAFKALKPVKGKTAGSMLRVSRRLQAALAAIAQALEQRDEHFFSKLAIGIKSVRERKENGHLSPWCHFVFGCVYSGVGGEVNPTKAEVIAMTKRIWALYRLFGDQWPNPTIRCNAETEARIKKEIERLPAQKWSRHFKRLAGIKLPEARRGPKPRRLQGANKCAIL
jgi:hypothetical protein